MATFILITGCSGGGKSTLLEALAAAGHRVVPEPGRRIVRDGLASGDQSALPWVDVEAFARRAIALSTSDLEAMRSEPGLVFFDRGLIDAAVGFHHASSVPLAETLGSTRSYADPVFLAPPWPELFQTDGERRHDFSEAVAEYERLRAALSQLRYDVRPLPKISVAERVSFVMRTVSGAA